MQLVSQAAENYASVHSAHMEGVLLEIEEYTRTHHPKSHMLSGSVQGKLLQFISQMVNPLHVLEIGTFTGYSAICLAAGLQPQGGIYSIELRENDAQTAMDFIQKAGLSERITVHVGNALNIIPTLEETWDLVFLDADKVNYIQYYELTLPKLKPGGWMIADNVLFHGEVLEEPIKGKNACAIHAFNLHVSADQRVEQVMLTIRDGLTLIRKK